MTEVCDDAVSTVTEVCGDVVSKVASVCDDAVSIATEVCGDVVPIFTAVCDDAVPKVTAVCNDAISIATEVCGDVVPIVTAVCDDAVSIVTEVCDDAVSIVTNTTRNSEENDNQSSPYKLLLGLTMLERKGVHQMDITDKTLSPVLPVQTSIWTPKEALNHSAMEDSDHDSVMSESLLLRHTEQSHAQHIDNPTSVLENQASQLLFYDTQSSGAHSEILPVQSVQPDCQASPDSTVSPVKHVSPYVYTQSQDMSRGHGSGTKRTQTEDPVDSSGNTDSLQAKVFHPNSIQSSGEIGSRLQPVKVFHPTISQSLEVDSQQANVSHTSFGDARMSCTQNSGDIDSHQDKVSRATSSTQSSGNDQSRCRKMGSGHVQSKSEQSPGKYHCVDAMAVLGDEKKKRISASQKGNEYQPTISPQVISPVSAEHDREEMIFRKIIKQQDYVDKQLRKSGLLADVNTLKQHMDTLQSLLRQLSDQQKSQRHRLGADVRSTSKTKQDRLRHKTEIEQLGKRQRQLIQLVQRQKTLNSKLKDIELTNDGSGDQIITANLSQHSHHQASQMTGSSQMTVTPPDTKETRVQDTQSSRSSRLTTESCSQSLLLGYTSNNPVAENIEQNRAVMSQPTKTFLSNTLIDNGSAQRMGQRQEGTSKVSANPSFECLMSQQKSNLIPINPRQNTITTSLVNQLDPVQLRSAPVQPNTHVQARSAPVKPSIHVATLSAPIQPNTHEAAGSVPVQSSIRVEARPALVLPSTSVEARPALVLPSTSVEEGSAGPVQIYRLVVSNRAETSARNNKLSTMIQAGLNTQHFDDKKTARTVSPCHTQSQQIPRNTRSKDTFSQTAVNPNIRSVQCIQTTSGKAKRTFVPPSVVKPQPNLSTIIISSPPPSQRQMTSHDPILFKSPPLQNASFVDNISPSTASCSDVFPVKSTEITRRIQQRRLLAESQKNTTECEVPIPVLKPFTKRAEEEHVTTTDVLQDQSEQPCSSPVQTKYPPLGTLIDRGVLVPEKGCLVTESQHGRYIGSLMDSGLIRGPGGEVFKTPVQWVSAVNDGVLVKKSRAYREVFYHGKPLLAFVGPGAKSFIDLTKNIDEPVSKRAPDNAVLKNNVNKQAPFDLETLLRSCTVRIISDDEVVTSSDLPENFWCDDFSNVRLPRSIQEQIDCW